MLSGDCNVCINRELPSNSATCVECGLSRKNYKPKTNADKLRSMSDEELAKHLCCPWKECKNMNLECDKCLLDWIRQEDGADGEG